MVGWRGEGTESGRHAACWGRREWSRGEKGVLCQQYERKMERTGLAKGKDKLRTCL